MITPGHHLRLRLEPVLESIGPNGCRCGPAGVRPARFGDMASGAAVRPAAGTRQAGARAAPRRSSSLVIVGPDGHRAAGPRDQAGLHLGPGFRDVRGRPLTDEGQRPRVAVGPTPTGRPPESGCRSPPQRISRSPGGSGGGRPRDPDVAPGWSPCGPSAHPRPYYRCALSGRMPGSRIGSESQADGSSRRLGLR